MPVFSWVKELVADVCGESRMKVGSVIKHPDGRTIKIVSGQYWGEHGVSNFWTWCEVKKGGKLGPEECGYGW